MIKLIGCVLIISACTQMGCAMATDKIRQMKYLKLFRRLIFETRAMVEGGMTFGEIILKLSLQKYYSDFTFMSVVPSFSKKSMAVCLISLSKSFDLYISSVILLRTSGEEVSCDKNVKSE